jgi:putative transposase
VAVGGKPYAVRQFQVGDPLLLLQNGKDHAVRAVDILHHSRYQQPSLVKDPEQRPDKLWCLLFDLGNGKLRGQWSGRPSRGSLTEWRQTPPPIPGYRFPAEVIRHAVWLCHVVSLSLREVELILAERGVTVTHESIGHWCRKFGAGCAAKLRRRRPKPGDTRHLDGVFLRINGELH